MLTITLRNLLLQTQEKLKPKPALFYFLFYFPAFFAVLYSLFTGSHLNLFKFFETAVFTSLLLLLSNFLAIYRLRFIYLTLVLVFVYATVFFETAYFHLYHSKISESTVYILLETNASETGDFLSMYFDKQILAICFCMFVPLFFAIVSLVRFLPGQRYLLNPGRLSKVRTVHPLVSSFILLVLLCGVLCMPQLRNQNIVYVAASSYKKYQGESKALQALSKDKFGGKFTSVSSDTAQEELYVMVIGESTTRHHMSLYNYYRNTTPLLSAKKDELIVYSDVISPHTHTINSLEKVLTLANFENPERSKDGTLLQLMNKAGFNTYWISNQCPIGTDETLVTALSKAAIETHFTNTAGWRSDAPLDEKLIPEFQQSLSENKKKKFIVLHLMGTHGIYTKRFSEAFDQFHGKPATRFEHEKAFNQINEYDNAILYNDFLVNQVIDLVKKENKKSWVMYFSDHGEDVFEINNSASHVERFGTKPMYDIPFLLWRSEQYKQADKNHVYQTDRKYMTDDLIHTIADLSHVRFAEFDSTRSIVNPGFVKRKRGINQKEDYDTKFSNQ